MRRIELLQHEENQFSGQYEDLSPYTAFTDTFLREQPLLTDDQAYGYELAMVADIMENLDDLQDLSHIFKEVQATGRMPYWGFHEAHLQDTWIKVEGYGLVSRQGNRYRSVSYTHLDVYKRQGNAQPLRIHLERVLRLVYRDRQESPLWRRRKG